MHSNATLVESCLSKRSLALVVTLLMGTVLFAATASSASALPPNFFGLMPNHDQAHTDSDLEAAARSGAKYWRIGFNCFEWYGDKENVWKNNWDEQVELAWKHGLQPLATVESRCKQISGEIPHEDEWGVWEEFARALVAHYGYLGSFWQGKENKKEIEVWEIQNEPNLAEHGWEGSTSGSAYAKVFKRASESIHSAQGNFFPSRVIVGGLYYVHNDAANKTPHTFMQEMAVNYPAVVPWIDGVAIHPYEWGSSAVSTTESDINGARNDIISFFGSGKTLWITEIGWNVENGATGYNEGNSYPEVNETEQSSRLTELFNWVRGVQETKKIQALIYYSYRDFEYNQNPWWTRAGLRRGAPPDRYSRATFRPAWYAFQSQTGAAKWPVAPQVETFPASGISATSATLNGVINPHGLPTGYHFEWAEGNEGFSHQLPAQAADAGWREGNVSRSVTLNGLKSSTKYRFRIVGTNENHETVLGSELTFTTKRLAAYQGPGGELWVSSLPSSAESLHLGMGTAGSKADIATLASGDYAIAFRSNGNELFTYSPGNGITNTHLGMMPGSTPSIAALSGGGYMVVFQSNEGELWTYSSNGEWTNLHLGMGYSASSPGIAPLPNGNFVIAFRAYGNVLFLYTPETGAVNLHQSMIAGASPSVTVLPNGLCEVAFQNGAGELSVYTPTKGVTNVGLGMGTQPSTPDIATLDDGSWLVAFRSNEGELWTYTPNGKWTNLHLGMGYTPTAPSITATGGSGYEIAFKAIGEELMTYSPSDGATATGLSVWQGSSPSIAG
jgi:hypothetical protein